MHSSPAARHSPLRIATRKSPLALAQAEEVRVRLMDAHPGMAARGVELVPMVTSGDQFQGTTLAEIGGKGLFTKELEEALFDGRADIAVHSMKDMQTMLPPGLVIGCVLPREDVRDVLIARHGAKDLHDLPEGAVVGTASLRRGSQVLHLRPDLRVIPFRGNVQTRLAKLEAGEADATLLAAAGLKRLQLSPFPGTPIPVDKLLPAAAQGAIGIECREGDAEILALLAPLHDAKTGIAVTCERALLAALDGSCRTPIAAYAVVEEMKRIRLRALLLTPDGTQRWAVDHEGEIGGAEALGREAGEQLRRMASCS